MQKSIKVEEVFKQRNVLKGNIGRFRDIKPITDPLIKEWVEYIAKRKIAKPSVC